MKCIEIKQLENCGMESNDGLSTVEVRETKTLWQGFNSVVQRSSQRSCWVTKSWNVAIHEILFYTQRKAVIRIVKNVKRMSIWNENNKFERDVIRIMERR